MKNKLILSLIFFAVLFLNPNMLFAQSSNLMLAVTEYESRDDIDFLFENSTQVLEYLEGVDVDRPLFLSLITSNQKELYIKKGFDPEILDENTDISRYVLLYNPRPDQASTLTPYGEPFVISSHYTLLKLVPGQTFTHEGESGKFFDVPFSDIISPPPLRVKTATELTLTPERSTTSSSPALLIIIVVIGFAVIIGSALFFYFKKKKSSY